MGSGACLPRLLRPPSESGARVPVWIPPTRSHRLRAFPTALPRLPRGKQGWGLRIRGGGTPFPFWGAGVWWVPGLGRGKMEILEKPGRHFSDAISTSASLGDACVALGLLDRSLTDAQMPRNQGRVTLHPFLPGTPPALVNSATICPANSARNSARAASAVLGSQLTSVSLVEPVPSAPPPLRLASPSTQRWPLKGAPCGSAGKESA